MSAWSLLSQGEYDAVWDAVYERFAFHPSGFSKDWPGIREPIPSATYSISAAYTNDLNAFSKAETDLHVKTLAAFRACLPSGNRLYALDWQHNCFWFYPHHEAATANPDEWRVSLFPNGDYYIFLAEDFRFGWFGHPWEQTVCVFGSSLLQSLEKSLPKMFTQPIRRNGNAAQHL